MKFNLTFLIPLSFYFLSLILFVNLLTYLIWLPLKSEFVLCFSYCVLWGFVIRKDAFYIELKIQAVVELDWGLVSKLMSYTGSNITSIIVQKFKTNRKYIISI